MAAIGVLRSAYDAGDTTVPPNTLPSLGRVWRDVLAGEERTRAFAACEVATLLALRRALRNGTVWIEHSLSFRSRERLFIPHEQWPSRRQAHYRRLGLLTQCEAFLEPLLERAKAGVEVAAAAATDGHVTVDSALHLTALCRRAVRVGHGDTQGSEVSGRRMHSAEFAASLRPTAR